MPTDACAIDEIGAVAISKWPRVRHSDNELENGEFVMKRTE